MKIYIGSDHAGFFLKEHLKAFLAEQGHDVEDAGAHRLDLGDDYVDFVSKVASAVSENQSARGIVLGGTGQAEAILANKYKGIRAALFYGQVVAKEAIDAKGSLAEDGYEIIRLSRAHNDANILSLGARFIGQDEACEAVSLWLKTPFGEEARHVRRVNSIKEIEKNI